LVVPFDRKRLAIYLQDIGIEFNFSLPIRQFAGGLANRNYFIELNGQPAVLRRPPDGDLPPGAYDMAREHRIVSKLAIVLPFVPRSFHFCADASIIGAPFQLVEYRPGLIIRGADLGNLSGDPAVSERLSEMLIELMAAVHAIDAEAVGLGDLGRPKGFVRRNIDNWTSRGFRIADGTPVRGVISDVRRWLDVQRFEERAPTILHCDLKLDNIIIDPNALTVRAVVDWDMSTRGDPLFDLATLLSYWAEPEDPECLRTLDQMPTTLPGFWSRDFAAQRYAALTNRTIDDLHVMNVFAMLKLGIVFLQLHRQWIDGAVSDPRYQAFGERGQSLLLHARDMAKGVVQ